MKLLPDRHFLHDLGISIDSDDRRGRAELPFVPEIANRCGAVRAGVLATLLDAAAGRVALRAALPQVIATSHLSFQTRTLPTAGPLVAHSRVLRRGRQSMAVGVRVHVGRDESAAVEGSVFFSMFPARGEGLVERLAASAAEPVSHRGRLDAGFLQQIGVRVVDGAAGRVELELSDYVCNHLAALQGGVAATLLEVAAELAAQEAVGAPVAVLDFSIDYLALGRSGPFCTRADIVRCGDGQAAVRTALVDADGSALCIGTAVAATPESGPNVPSAAEAG